MIRPYTQSRQDDDYYRLLNMCRKIAQRLKVKLVTEDLTNTEIMILVQVSTILGRVEQ